MGDTVLLPPFGHTNLIFKYRTHLFYFSFSTTLSCAIKFLLNLLAILDISSVSEKKISFYEL